MLILSLLFDVVRGRPGMGMGYIEWALSLGIAFGWLGAGYVMLFLYATIASSLLVLVLMLAGGRADAPSRLPYGPYLAVATVLVAMLGDPIGRALFG